MQKAVSADSVDRVGSIEKLDLGPLGNAECGKAKVAGRWHDNCLEA
jgi:hypothetical protein